MTVNKHSDSGVSYRNYFAGEVLMAIYQHCCDKKIERDSIADECFLMADAMIVRGKTPLDNPPPARVVLLGDGRIVRGKIPLDNPTVPV